MKITGRLALVSRFSESKISCKRKLLQQTLFVANLLKRLRSGQFTFWCTNGDFYVVLGSSMGLALLVWGRWWSVNFIFFW